MHTPIDLSRLKDFFAEEDVDWKPIAVSKKTGKALAAAYVTNRAIMDRLDEVCGPENWKNQYRPGPGGGVICGLSIRVGDEWVTKWDGAENTDVEAVKGGLSTSMRRAAVQWGIGRYIYRLPSQWIPIDQNRRFSQKPRISSDFLPPRSTTHRSSNGRAAASSSTVRQPAAAERRIQPTTQADQQKRIRSTKPNADEYRMPG